MNKVTIAIPTYNRKEYLKECIESILNQSFNDFEILVFDNHSDYDMVAFLDTFNDSRITLQSSDLNLGNRGNFARIFEFAYKTEYLVVFHDDDTMHPNFLEYNLFVLDNNTEIIWSASEARFVKDDKKMNNFHTVGAIDSNIYTAKEVVKNIFKDYDLCFDSVVYRTNYIQGWREFENSYSKWLDRPFLLSLIQEGNVALLEHKLVNYRIHKGQDSQNITDSELQNTLKHMANLLSFYKSFFDDPMMKKDKKLFFRYTNETILSLARTYASNVKEYQTIITFFKSKGLWKNLVFSARSIYHMLRSVHILF